MGNTNVMPSSGLRSFQPHIISIPQGKTFVNINTESGAIRTLDRMRRLGSD
jgi:hypothetical protein